MPSDKFECLNRVRAVEREYLAMRYAADRLIAGLHQDASLLRSAFQAHDVQAASERLEATYIIRLFAEFETILRLFWAASRGTDPPDRTRDLLGGVGARRRIPHDQIQNAHLVREHRNTLVHESAEEAESVPIGLARSHLCRYLNFLPPEW